MSATTQSTSRSYQDGSSVDVTQSGAAAPLVLLFGVERRTGGPSVPFLNIQNACSFVSSIKHRGSNERGSIFGGGEEKEGKEEDTKKKKKKKNKNNTWFSSWWCVVVVVFFNAPKLPGGMNLWLSPSGRSLHLHLLSNQLKNAPERKKQKEPFRLRHFRAWKQVNGVFLRVGGLGGERESLLLSLSFSVFLFW